MIRKKSFCYNIKSSRFYKELENDIKVENNKLLHEYNHPTFTIKSISEFINILNILKSTFKFNTPELCFRGMSNYEWSLLPHLGRKFMNVEFYESEMINEVLTLKPEEFTYINSNFDLLSKLQHYGLPTRLLDFTTNPLVALFFACQKGQKSSMGRIVCTHNSCSHNDDKLVEAICGMCKISDYSNVWFEDVSKNNFSLLKYLAAKQFPLMSKPKYSNERIKRQSAIFMIFDNIMIDENAKFAYKLNQGIDIKDLPQWVQDSEFKLEQILFIRDKENLKEIYENKSNKNAFSEFYVSYKSLHKLMDLYEEGFEVNDLNNCENNNDYLALKKRFVVLPELAPVEQEILQNEFCSILIDPKHKSKILDELDSLNINEQYLFPELEYTTKSIKKKYFD